MADVVRDNRRILETAKAQGRQVRFVYSTKTSGDLVPRVGTVREFTDTNHATINDTFHGGQPRSVILDRIVGRVEVQ